MSEVLTEAQLLAMLGGPQPQGLAMTDLIRTLFANGEYLSTSVLIADKVALVTDTAKTIASLALTPGEWDISGVIAYVPAASTSITYLRQSISDTADTDGAAIQAKAHPSAAVVPGATNVPILDTPRVRLVLSGAATYYLVAHAIFTVSTLHGYGLLQARRVR